MRITLIIVSCLAMVVAAGMGLMTASNNLSPENQKKLEEAKVLIAKVSKLNKELGGKADKKMNMAAGLLEKSEGYTTSGIAGIILAILSLAVVVTIFLKKKMVVLVAVGLTFLATILFIFLAPGFETSEFGPASPRTQVLVFGIAAMVAAAAAFGADWLYQSRQARQIRQNPV